MSGKPVTRALLTGAFGGALHGSAKITAPHLGLPAVALGAVGTSIVANAGRGAGMLDEVMLPLGPARLRLSTDGPRRINVALNAYEGAMLVSRLMKPGMRVDWQWSLQSGAVVLRTADRIYGGGRRANGLTSGSVITLTDRAWFPEEVFNHERVHVQQQWFLHEVWGRPIEMRLRERTRELRWIPGWLEIGFVTPALVSLESNTIGVNGPLRSLRESEAETVEELTRRY